MTVEIEAEPLLSVFRRVKKKWGKPGVGKDFTAFFVSQLTDEEKETVLFDALSRVVYSLDNENRRSADTSVTVAILETQFPKKGSSFSTKTASYVEAWEKFMNSTFPGANGMVFYKDATVLDLTALRDSEWAHGKAAIANGDKANRRIEVMVKYKAKIVSDLTDKQMQEFITA